MLFKTDRNVWRVAPASRAAMLVDAATYFGAVRSAMVKAQRSILVAGWDLHAQTRLVGPSGEADDGYPATLAEFLIALVTERPQLEISLLLWDFPVLYAAERDPFPTYSLRWNTPPQIRFCLDDCVPLGSSQHQKIVVVDDKVAFSGGLDITIRRWDTNAHRLDDPHRIDPAGKTYKPFHDVQMVIDGKAAEALGELMRLRWSCAALEMLRRVSCDGDPWPDHVNADFNEIDIAIARTQPRYEDQPEVLEVERLYHDSIDTAERTIYIENQFLTSEPIAERLARRLRERPALELLIVAPNSHDSWFEAHSMKAGRVNFAKIVRDAGGDRVHLVYPQVSGGGRSVPTMVHSKVMVIDDTLLRVGSANLNNRSMGTDTECDLAIVANTDAERARIVEMRNRLLGDHTGCSAELVATAIQTGGGSLIAAAKALGRNGHSLEPIEDIPEAPDDLSAAIQSVADPRRPFGIERFIRKISGGVPARHVATMAKIVFAGLALIALALAWRYMPLAKPEAVRAAFASIAESHWAPVIVIMTFVGAGLVMFPVLMLIAASAAAFGPWFGFTYAALGALASAVVGYSIGAAVGKRPLRNILGPRLNKVRQRIAKRGVIAVAAIRLVPIAPFTVVNLVAGASGIPVFDFIAGTLLGLLPGLIAISAVGHQFARIMTSPAPMDFVLLGAAVMAWIAVSIGIQAMVSRWSNAR
jgi:phospholipase D1/2